MLNAPADPQSARIVLTVSMLGNTLECFDDLDITLTPAANRHAEGCLKIMGPAAVFTAILQAAPALASSERVSDYVDIFVHSAVRRRRELIASLPEDIRESVLAHEATRSVEPQRVIDLFTEAVSGSALPALIDRVRSNKDIAALEARITRQSAVLAEDEEVAADAPTQAEAIDAMDAMPMDGLRALGSAIADTGLDELALARVLDGVLPPETPEGYLHDGVGTLRREEAKVGRNDPCPCGSGRKYKKCHGRKAAR
jgi:hypothetical protein